MITDKMIHAGMEKALDLGLLPRKGIEEDIATNSEIIEEILRAAMDAGADDQTVPVLSWKAARRCMG